MAANGNAGGTASRASRSLVAFIMFAMLAGLVLEAGAEPGFAALVFSKTTGFRHDSIPHGLAAIEALGAEHGISVDSTEDSGRFTAADLARYRVVVFLSTTGDILDSDQKAAFEGFTRAGGFLGIRSAATPSITGLGTAGWSAPISQTTRTSSWRRFISRIRVIPRRKISRQFGGEPTNGTTFAAIRGRACSPGNARRGDLFRRQDGWRPP